MKIEIVPVVETTSLSTLKNELTKPNPITSPSTIVELDKIFAEFLEMEVGDGAASADTIRSYLSQTKQYLNWCRDNLLSPLNAEADDIKQYRQYLVQSGYQNSTIATKLNIVRIFYKAALNHGLIKILIAPMSHLVSIPLQTYTDQEILLKALHQICPVELAHNIDVREFF